MYPALVDRQPLHRLLSSISEALDLRLESIKRDNGYSDHMLIGDPRDVSAAGRSLRTWGFQYVIADVNGSGAIKAIIVKWVWTPKRA